MRPSEALKIHKQKIREIILSNQTVNPRIFGSVLTGKDTDESDLDILVDPTSKTTLMDIGAIRHQLLSLLKVPVDILTPNSLPYNIRSKILKEATPL